MPLKFEKLFSRSGPPNNVHIVVGASVVSVAIEITPEVRPQLALFGNQGCHNSPVDCDKIK